MLWDLLIFNWGKLRSLRSTLDSEQLRGNSWRADYKEALERFTVGFWTICDTAIVQLRQAASMSKPLQKYWTFGLDEGGTTSVLDNSDRKKWPPVVVLIDELFKRERDIRWGHPR